MKRIIEGASSYVRNSSIQFSLIVIDGPLLYTNYIGAM